MAGERERERETEKERERETEKEREREREREKERERAGGQAHMVERPHVAVRAEAELEQQLRQDAPHRPAGPPVARPQGPPERGKAAKRRELRLDPRSSESILVDRLLQAPRSLFLGPLLGRLGPLVD